MSQIKLSLLAVALFAAVGTAVANEQGIADGWYLTDGSGPYATNPAYRYGTRVLCSTHFVNNIIVETTNQN